MPRYLLLLLLPLFAAFADTVVVSDLQLKGTVVEDYLRFELQLDATALKNDGVLTLPFTNAAMIAAPASDDYRIVASGNHFRLRIKEANKPVKVNASFSMHAQAADDGAWRRLSIPLPTADRRQVAVTSADRELALVLDGAIRQTQDADAAGVTVTGVLQPNRAFGVSWKPRVELQQEAELLFTVEGNHIVTLNPGVLRVDALYACRIAQGKLRQLRFDIPEGLTITQVRGPDIRDWQITNDKGRILTVQLSREQEKNYALQILAEQPVAPLPTEVDLPVVEPLDANRAGGHLLFGTDSSLQLAVREARGLNQIETAAFPRAMLQANQPRPLPGARSFAWSFATYPWQLRTAAEDVTPTYDVETRIVANATDDDLVLHLDFDLDVREAPLRTLPIQIPTGFTVAAVEGAAVKDHAVTTTDGIRTVDVIFNQPVSGRTAISIRLERGDSPIDQDIAIGDVRVPNARNQRGYLAVAAGEGVSVAAGTVTELRPVNVRSIPMRVARAELAWRFRTADWRLELAVTAKPAKIRAEAFHLVSLGEGVAYGNVALTYLISGAPVDELRFRVDPALSNLEFVGVDVTRWYQEDDVWVVKLRRKVIDDYNLGVSWSKRFASGDEIMTGGVACADVETQTGFVAIASHLSLDLSTVSADPSVIKIASDEIPNHYRLLVTAPVLASWKYVSVPHVLKQTVSTRPAGATPAAIAEFVHADTQLSVTDSGATESVTKVQYVVKNANAQFLDLKLPEGANAWTARIIKEDGSERIPTAAADGMLKIPLSRGHNPNEPLKIELEYGLDHGKLPWSGNLGLLLPASPIPGAFTDWQIVAPGGWHLTGGTARFRPTGGDATPLIRCIQGVLHVWERAVTRGGVALLFAGLFIVAALIARRRLASRILIPFALLLITLAAVIGLNRNNLQQPPVSTTVQFHQVLQLNADTLPQVALNLRPDWQRNVRVGLLVLGSLLALGGIGGAFSGKLPKVIGGACACTGSAVVLAMFPIGALILVHLCTWVPPLIAAILYGFRGRFFTKAAAVALACVFMVPSSARAASPEVTVSTAELTIVEEAKALSTTWHLAGSTDVIHQISVAPANAVVIDNPSKATLVRDGNNLVLVVTPGDFDHKFQLLLSLPATAAEPAGQRQILVPLPASAVTNRVKLTVNRPGITIEAPGAAYLETDIDAKGASATAAFPPGTPAQLVWRPKTRSTAEEKAVFYAESATLATAAVGMVEAVTAFNLRIAQGQLQRLQLTVPEGVVVTQAVGSGLGTWRFDPASRKLELRFVDKRSGDLAFLVASQQAAASLPYQTTLRPIVVDDAQRPRNSLGIRPGPEVQLTVGSHPPRMSPEDFARAATSLPKFGQLPPHTYRMTGDSPEVSINVAAVLPEVRIEEQASFSVGDDRLVLSSSLGISITRTGRFDLPLLLPPGYDVDTVSGPDVSHWDDTEVDGGRRVTLHFAKSLLGNTRVSVGLSRPIPTDNGPLEVPRIAVDGALKHTGQLVVSAARGTRLGIVDRDGVSELDPARLELQNKPALAFRILRPDWRLTLSRETLTPRLQVDYLHLANVSDGIIRHTHFRRYRLQNAGTKELRISVPANTLGLTITGPDVARRENLGDGIWRIELGEKWFDREYPLRVSYETKYDPASTSVPIEPMNSVDADLQRGFVVVLSSNRVELTATSTGESLQPADARNVPGAFGAGDLSGAVFCYRCNLPTYQLAIAAQRHGTANLLTAEVKSLSLDTVVSRSGHAITRVAMQIAAGRRRHLGALLPPGANVWSLLVDRQARRPAHGDDDLLLIPLPQDESGSLEVTIDLVYVTPGNGLSGKAAVAGPQFDLPLRNVTWNLHLPPDHVYEDFGGTMRIDEDSIVRPQRRKYDVAAYSAALASAREADLEQAQILQSKGLELANTGKQQQARQALEQAYNYSQADRSLNEDARVVLRNLLKQQAVVGLVSRRAGIRKLDKQGYDEAWQADFTNQQAERLQSGLNQEDNRNLERITGRVVEYQEAAADTVGSLMVNLPIRGLSIQATRALQVNPKDPMEITFRVGSSRPDWLADVVTILGTIVTLSLIFLLLGKLLPAYDTAVINAEQTRASKPKREIVLWKKKATTEPVAPASPRLAPDAPADAMPTPTPEPAPATADDSTEAEPPAEEPDTPIEPEPPSPPPLPEEPTEPEPDRAPEASTSDELASDSEPSSDDDSDSSPDSDKEDTKNV